jgi:ABC-type oligopeptide transport system substrate-binding subunit
MSVRLATRIALLAATVTAAGLLAACGPKSTTGPTSTTVCRDGTHTTSTGRGTCSGHGGIRR